MKLAINIANLQSMYYEHTEAGRGIFICTMIHHQFAKNFKEYDAEQHYSKIQQFVKRYLTKYFEFADNHGESNVATFWFSRRNTNYYFTDVVCKNGSILKMDTVINGTDFRNKLISHILETDPNSVLEVIIE